ncbi:hypothetical protein TNCV_3318161 [Trichonephila clavipes]|nr:hypothetical protein TNCV_3318161 [Trichonephila clavipes]
MYRAFAAWGTLNSHQAAKPLVRLLEKEERNCGGGDRGGVAIYRPFGEFRRAKIALSQNRIEALSASPPTNRNILTDDENNSVVIPFAKRSKRYNPPAIHVMAFILAIQG